MQERFQARDLRKAKNEGTIIPLFALLALPLILLVAMVIDLGFSQISRQKWQGNNEVACLSALEEYMVSKSAPASRVNRALDRARSILGITVTHDFRFLEGRGSNKFQNKFEASPLGGTGTPGANGLLTFGQIEDQDPCPGDTCSSCFKTIHQRCFQPASTPDSTVTAAQLKVFIDSASPLQGFFEGLFNGDYFRVSAEAHCAVTPRQIVAGIDVSRSSIEDNFISYASLANSPGGLTQANLRARGPSEFSYAFNLSYDEDPETDIFLSTSGGTSAVDIGSENLCLPEPNNSSVIPAERRYYPVPSNPYPIGGAGGTDHKIFRLYNYPRTQDPQVPMPPTSTEPNFTPPIDDSPPGPQFYPYTCPLSGPTNQRTYYHTAINRDDFPGGNPPSARHFMSDFTWTFNLWRQCINYSYLKECLKTCNQDPTWTDDQVLECYATSGDYCNDNSKCNPFYHMALTHRFLDLRPGPTFFNAPRPLGDFFDALNQLTKSFNERFLAGDEIGAFAFRNTTFVPQSVIPLAETGSERFKALETLVDLEDNESTDKHPGPPYYQGLNDTKQFKTMLAHGFFPIIPSTGGQPYTNIELALKQAIMMFEESSGSSPVSLKDVVIATDGRGNCVAVGTPGNPNQPQQIDCGGDFDHYMASFNAINATVDDFYIPRNVRFNLVLTSSGVVPHYKLFKSSSGCADLNKIQELKLQDITVGDQGDLETAYNNRLTQPFYHPNLLADAAVRSGGRFIPLQPACHFNGAPADISSKLNQFCNAQYSGQPDGTPVTSGLPITESTLGGTGSQVIVDAQGRVVCDIYGRSTSEQARAGMDAIMGSNSFRLVSLAGP